MKINPSFSRLKTILIAILLLQFHFGFSQEKKNSELYKTIMSKDSLLFNVGFNTCDISQFENLFSDDLEFYHDKVGASDKALFLKNFRKGLCGSTGTYQSRRYLVPNTTEVYPLYDKGVLYGAMQMGIHQFYEKSAGKNESLANAKENFASTARFTHVWILTSGVWKLRRCFSYDHQTAKNSETETK
ncbi:nuclear transport factor 2 family protein [Flavobacterium sp. N1736]|uniref:nuclear transport factor 2 family protein n=1 Tax=Flavobacterium sp. N1736 TaxID=2986823 RepID=UPI00222593E0|nr:nuclear transport factor 2 family protein [Flavobacterium sp. N1736]